MIEHVRGVLRRRHNYQGLAAPQTYKGGWGIELKTLPRVTATAEQLPLISQNRFGVEVICGAAGSGKTSTALLRLRSLCLMFAARHARLAIQTPVRVLVLTFNRTLAGYVRSLAENQIAPNANIDLRIDTFGRWASYAGIWVTP